MSVNITLFKKYKQLIIIYLIFILFFAQIIRADITNCPRNNPILISGQCKSIYCSETQFASSNCIIVNSTAKTQWLNNIIIFGESNSRYVNFAVFSNGNIVAETSTYPISQNRMFYGLKNNGRPLFTISNEETYYLSMNSNNPDGMFESEGGII